MADESIESLKAQIASLSRENQRLVGENTRRKRTNRNLQAKLDTATTSSTQANRDGSKADKDSGKGNDDNGEIEVLRNQIRSYKHRDGLAELAYSPEIGINRAIPIDRIMKLADYKPTGDEFDPKSAKQLLVALKDSDPYLFEQVAGAGGQSSRQGNGTPLAQGVAAVGSAFGRGSSPGPLDDQALSEEQLRDPAFMSRYHAEKRMAAKK